MNKLIGGFVMAVGVLLGGCTGGPKPIAEIGFTAYEGGTVQMNDGFGILGGGEKHKIDPDVSRHAVENYDKVRIYVQRAEAGKLDMASNVVFNEQSMLDELTKATEEASVRWGRFVRVSDESQAQVIVRPRVSTMVAWGDWSKSLDQMSADYQGLQGAALADISREGLDMVIALNFYEPSTGNHIASSEVIARQVSRRGEIFNSGSSNEARATERVMVRNASIDERRLAQVISLAVTGAFVGSFQQTDSQFWDIENDKGRRVVKLNGKDGVVPVGANDPK